jgi:hypothetical protein
LAAFNARQAVTAADRHQKTGGVSDALQALAYASENDVRRAPIVAATASIPSIRPAAFPARNPMAVDSVTTVIAKGAQGQRSTVSISRRLAPATVSHSDTWMRAMILAPSASRTMLATVIGEQDMTLMQVYFDKPDRMITMAFSDDSQMGMVCDRFTGSAVAKLTTTALETRAASPR